jgi:hypothetical protein
MSMTRKRFTAERTVRKLREAEVELARGRTVSRAMLRWHRNTLGNSHRSWYNS